jgi:hypothetical protein
MVCRARPERLNLPTDLAWARRQECLYDTTGSGGILGAPGENKHLTRSSRPIARRRRAAQGHAHTSAARKSRSICEVGTAFHSLAPREVGLPNFEKIVKIGARIVGHGRYVTFQMAEVAVSRDLFGEILRLTAELRPPPTASPA